MMALAAVLALSDVLLGLVVFALLARPEAFLGVLAGWTGESRAWDEGRLDELGRLRLLALADRAAVPALILLFAWSFLAGAALLASRL